MAKIATYYDDLQVSRTASPEVIRAAYKGLSQKWHPDRHPAELARSEEMMRSLNRAYEVLSDPAKRARHDAWIAEREAAPADNLPMRRQQLDSDRSSARKDAPATSQGGLFQRDLGANLIGAIWITYFLARQIQETSQESNILYIFVYVAVVCFFVVKAVGANQKGSQRASATYFALAYSCAYVASTILELKFTRQIPTSGMALFGGIVCWFAAGFIVAWVSTSTILGCLRGGAVLRWRTAYVFQVIVGVIIAAGNLIAIPAALENALSAGLPVPGFAALMLVVIATLAFAELGLAALMVGMAAAAFEAFRTAPRQKAAWSLMIAALMWVFLGATFNVVHAVQFGATAANKASSPRIQGAASSEQQRILEEHAARWYRRYPFLDNKSPDANPNAIAAVIARRDELVRKGAPIENALDVAVAEIGQKFSDR